MQIMCCLGELAELLIVSSSTLNCLSLNPLSFRQDLLPATV